MLTLSVHKCTSASKFVSLYTHAVYPNFEYFKGNSCIYPYYLIVQVTLYLVISLSNVFVYLHPCYIITI